MQGVDLRKQDWSDLIGKDKANELLTPVLALHEEYLQRSASGEDTTIAAEERENLVKQIISNLSALYQQYANKQGGAPRTLH